MLPLGRATAEKVALGVAFVIGISMHLSECGFSGRTYGEGAATDLSAFVAALWMAINF